MHSVRITLKKYLVMLAFIVLVQERLTKQIAVAVTQAIQPAGVAVVIEGV